MAIYVGADAVALQNKKSAQVFCNTGLCKSTQIKSYFIGGRVSVPR